MSYDAINSVNGTSILLWATCPIKFSWSAEPIFLKEIATFWESAWNEYRTCNAACWSHGCELPRCFIMNSRESKPFLQRTSVNRHHLRENSRARVKSLWGSNFRIKANHCSAWSLWRIALDREPFYPNVDEHGHFKDQWSGQWTARGTCTSPDLYFLTEVIRDTSILCLDEDRCLQRSPPWHPLTPDRPHLCHWRGRIDPDFTQGWKRRIYQSWCQ